MATPPAPEQPGPSSDRNQPLWQPGPGGSAPPQHAGGQSAWVSGLALFGGVVMLVEDRKSVV